MYTQISNKVSRESRFNRMNTFLKATYEFAQSQATEFCVVKRVISETKKLLSNFHYVWRASKRGSPL